MAGKLGPCGKLYNRQGKTDICGRDASHNQDGRDPTHIGRWTGVEWVGEARTGQVVTNLDTLGLPEAS